MPRELLMHRLAPVLRAERQARARRIRLGALVIAWLIGWGVWLTEKEDGLVDSGTGLAWLACTVAFVWIVHRGNARRAVDPRKVARRVEARHPALQGRLLTALDQDGEKGRGYLEERVISEAVSHSMGHDWTLPFRQKREKLLSVANILAWFAVASLGVQMISVGTHRSLLAQREGSIPGGSAFEFEVFPGNTEVEKGTRLIVEARFAHGLPSDVAVEVRRPVSGELLRRHPMRQNLDDPVFAVVIPEIAEPVQYLVTHGAGRSDLYEVGVYEHPRLEQADVTVTPPAYAGLESRTIRDVRKVTALEGSELGFSFRVNQPVVAAELFGEDESVIELQPSPEDPLLLTAAFRPEADRKYRLHLVDAADRANKVRPWFQVKLRKNQLPNLEMIFPGKDVEVSALQEVSLQGKAWDDLGLNRVGATVTVGEQTGEIVLSEGALAGKAKHELATLLPLEDYGAEPNQLVSYHFWAEDFGPNGETRRTESDMFFAEVRDWEMIFRQGVQQGGEGQGPQNQSGELRQQQKDVINATWKVIRRATLSGVAGQLEDVAVIRQAQDTIAENVNQVLGKVEDSRLRSQLQSARERMMQAVSFLQWVEENADERVLADAMTAERAAYQHLLAAESREIQVTRSKSSSAGQSGQQKQRQLMQLDLKENEDRYEKQSEARPEEANAEQAENLQVLSRLKELARRQEALAEKIQELEAALEAAQSEEEKKELERQLKRLQEEQEQLLRDMDELSERMDSEPNQERMAAERDHLADAREQVQQANEQLAGKELTEASNSARRAQQKIEEIREEFRQRTSNRFADEMREMRQQARDLAESQEAIGEKFEDAPKSGRDLAREANESFDPAAVSRELTEQKEKLDALLERMRRVSEQAEESEPVLSDAIYDSVRQARIENPAEALEKAARWTRYGVLADAHEKEREASRAIDTLKEGVEDAAETALGSESDALRMARKELDDLIEAVENERKQRQENAAPGEETSSSSSPPTEVARNDRTEKPADSEAKEPQGNARSPEQQQGPQPGEGGNPQPGPDQLPEDGERQSVAGATPQPDGEGQQPVPGEQPGEGQQPGEGPPPGRGRQMAEAGSSPGTGNQARGSASNGGGATPSGANWPGGGEDRGPDRPGGALAPARPPLFFDQAANAPKIPGPLMGDGYNQWSDDLRKVEQMLEDPELRAGAAKVLDRARSMRIDYRRNDAPPQWDLVQTSVVDPLVELRQRVAESLALLEKDNPLVPVDRDPVPGPYRELVRRYYEKLASGE